LSYRVAVDGLEVLRSAGLDSATLEITRAQAAQRLGWYGEAHAGFERASELRPPQLQASWSLGVRALENRRFREAAGHLQLVLDAVDTPPVNALLAMGVAQKGIGDFDRARSYFVAAAEQDRTDPRPWFNLGLLQYHHEAAASHSMEETIAHLRSAARSFDVCMGLIDRACAEDSSTRVACLPDMRLEASKLRGEISMSY